MTIHDHDFRGERTAEWMRGYAAGRAVTPDDLRRARASVDRSIRHPADETAPANTHLTVPGRMTFTVLEKKG